MRTSRSTDERIVGFLRQSEAGLPVRELCRKGDSSDAIFYKSLAHFASGLPTSARCPILAHPR